jgi:hypothetical protein
VPSSDQEETVTDPVDVPEADRLEQELAVTEEVGSAAVEPVLAPSEVDPADAAEQSIAVPLDEDDAPR